MSQQVIGTDDRRSLHVRLSVLQYGLAITFSALTVAFWVFQVAQGAQFEEIARNQYIQTVPLPAPRGVVFDRNGEVLVDNQHKFNIVLLRDMEELTIDEIANHLATTRESVKARLHRARLLLREYLRA